MAKTGIRKKSTSRSRQPQAAVLQQDTASPLSTNIMAPSSAEYTFPTEGDAQLNERVQVYVRVRPIFKHELMEDREALQTMKQIGSPSPLKGRIQPNYSDEEDGFSE